MQMSHYEEVPKSIAEKLFLVSYVKKLILKNIIIKGENKWQKQKFERTSHT